MMIDSEIFDLSTRLRQIQDETELLNAQRVSLLFQLRVAETARDRRRNRMDGSADVATESFRGRRVLIHDNLDEASEESFPRSDAPAWTRGGST